MARSRAACYRRTLLDLGTWTGARIDPALPYLVFATALLAAVAVVSGALRRDHQALRHGSTFVKLLAAVAAAVLLAHLTHLIATHPPTDDTLWTRLSGVYRLPLWLAALAYGPSIGMIAGLATWSAAGLHAAPVAASPVLVIELVVLGWLSIYPSPRRHRWAGPADALAAYVLAWGTAGLMQLYVRGQRVSWPALVDQHEAMAFGALLAVLGLLAFGPRTYRLWFPESRLRAEPTSPADAEG